MRHASLAVILACFFATSLFGCTSSSTNQGSALKNESSRITSLGGGSVSADGATQITWGKVKASAMLTDTGIYLIRLRGLGEECSSDPSSVLIYLASIDPVELTRSPLTCEADATSFTVNTYLPTGEATNGSFRYLVNLVSPPQ